ncbi:hypothetical protein BC831DRAFT_461516 [Entophlyctis helioformis]|nr:hypothetical protein BC831DRAFT_461516 [Entophlyctis helioformis]
MAIPSEVTTALGIIGGTLLSFCSIPQLVVMWKNRSARDVSMAWIVSLTLGLMVQSAYLILLEAWAGAIPLIVQVVLAVGVLGSKIVLDNGMFGMSTPLNAAPVQVETGGSDAKDAKIVSA